MGLHKSSFCYLLSNMVMSAIPCVRFCLKTYLWWLVSSDNKYC